MEYRKLGRSGIDVSVICLGTMTFGEQNTEAEGHAQLDYALQQGVNFIDTAELYSIPPKPETQGSTELIIGSWLKKRQCRDKVILATKVIGPGADWLPWFRDGKSCLDKDNIQRAVDGSLKRLQTDYIDLYQLHWPDRPTNYFGSLGYTHQEKQSVPILETLQALDELVKAGKIREVGLSNETPWGVMEFLRLSAEKGLPRMQSVQNPYSLLNRTYEVGLAEISHREDIGLLAYSPLAFGMLTGKYSAGKMPEGSRLALFPAYDRYSGANSKAASEDYVQIARQAGMTATQMALSFINSRPFVTSNIIGATSLEQLAENISSLDVKLPAEMIEKIEAVHQRYPNPAP